MESGNVLHGKTAVITGGSAGIGRAIVELFARSGACVTFTARGAERAQAVVDGLGLEGYNAVFVPGDVSKPEDVRNLIRTVTERFGRIDCAVNNAASLGQIRQTADYTENEFDAEVNANLRSVWLCMKYELEQMQEQIPQGGTIVNVSSVNGLGGARGASLYSMSKAAILGLTKSAAMEYAAKSIRVNALVAGGFDTDMLRDAIRQIIGDDPDKLKEALKSYESQTPLARIGNPAEAAQAILWLCGSASSYVTGHSMIVDGGLTCWAR